jgi:glutamate synthase (NADPH/NADH) small chain
MVDGTGMCGACRVTVNGKTKFVCVDGPEFDAHAVDFDEMLSRLRQYKNEEVESMSLGGQEFSSLGVTSEQVQSTLDSKASKPSVTPLVPPFAGTAKDRVAIPRVKMNELKPEERIQSLYAEVNQGLTFEQAVTEAHRCLNCKKPTCVEGCPVNINIPGFIKQLEIGNILGAAEIIGEILPEFAKELGINQNVKVVCGAHDQYAANVGSNYFGKDLDEIEQKALIFAFYMIEQHELD